MITKIKEPTKRFMKWLNDYSDIWIEEDSSYKNEYIPKVTNMVTNNQLKKMSKYFKGEIKIYNGIIAILDGKGKVSYVKEKIIRNKIKGIPKTLKDNDI